MDSMKALQHITLLLSLPLATSLVACDDGQDQDLPAADNNQNNSDNSQNNANNNQNNGDNNAQNNSNNNVVVAGQLLVEGDAARSCEVMLRDVARHVDGVAFGEDVEGRDLRRGDMLALTFFTQSDAPFSANAVGLQADALEGVEVVSGRCFDKDGTETAAPTITIQR